MADQADRLAEAKRRIAREHLGDERLGARLRGGNAAQLREDAERVREEAGLPDRGRSSFDAALHVARRDREDEQRLWGARLFGERR
jgi:hypothetical protein